MARGYYKNGIPTQLGKHHTEETKEKLRQYKGRIPWNKGKKGLYKHSEETRKKIGLKGDKNPAKRPEVRRKMSISGSKARKKMWENPEYRKKMTERMKGNKYTLGFKPTKETRQKMSEAHKGRITSEDTRRKMSEIAKKNGFGKWTRGRKLSKEHKRKISKSHIGIHLGSKNPNWHGGLSFKPYPVYWTKTLKRSIRERDHYICQKCSQYGNAIHHIDYDKKNCNPTNLITLCNSCNLKVNHNRNYWTNYFNNLMILKVVSNLT